GRVTHWQGSFGWITPMDELPEDLQPLADQGRVYLNWRDLPAGLSPKVGLHLDFSCAAGDAGLVAADVVEHREGAGVAPQAPPGRRGRRARRPPPDPMAQLERQWAREDALLGAHDPDPREPPEEQPDPAGEDTVRNYGIKAYLLPDGSGGVDVLSSPDPEPPDIDLATYEAITRHLRALGYLSATSSLISPRELVPAIAKFWYTCNMDKLVVFPYTFALRSMSNLLRTRPNEFEHARDRDLAFVLPLKNSSHKRYGSIPAGRIAKGGGPAMMENVHGQSALPALPAGLTYTQVAAGAGHTVLLRTDGSAVACGQNGEGVCALPALPAGLTYTQVAAGDDHTVLLRSDGSAVACGQNCDGQCALPALPAGFTYTQVAAGMGHTVLLRTDGSAVACGRDDEGQCALPALPAGLTCTQVAAGGWHTVVLRSDGSAVACGQNGDGQCALPALPAGLTYTQVAAGLMHTVLLRSDGSAVACGQNDEGQCALPALPARLTYTQVAAGETHSVLLRSDGTAVACGWNGDGECALPALPAGLTYTAHLLPAMLLQASLDGDTMRFMTFGGAERSRSWAGPAARLADIYEQLLADHRAGRLGPGAWRVDAVLPGGRLLSSAAAEETVAECALPALPAGLTYTPVAAGLWHAVLLWTDGSAVARGWNVLGQCALPALPAGLTWTQVAVGGMHSLLVRSDGTAVACGQNDQGQCALPALPADLTCTQVAAGGWHTVLLWIDDSAVACGQNAQGQCALLALPAGLTYTPVAAGLSHAVLLQRDGTACAVPALPAGLTYTASLLPAMLL
ncbi:unnamed protein product, partial [Prorocentrum cordatum]